MNVHVPTNICYNSTRSYTCTLLQKAIGGNLLIIVEDKTNLIYFIYMSINDSNLQLSKIVNNIDVGT